MSQIHPITALATKLRPSDIIAYHRAYCKKSFYYFVRYFWDTVIAEPPVWNWHIEYLCDELQAIGERVAMLSRHVDPFTGQPAWPVRLSKEYDYVIINIPPGSSKSTIVSEMWPMWLWTLDASLRFICGSYASTPAEDIAEKCFSIYQSDKYLELFPELRQLKYPGGKTHFRNGIKGERYTTSTGSAITGIHAHVQIIDDPMNPQIAASKVEREKANKWVSETMGSRKVSAKYTVTVIVMQRLHEMDTTGYLLKKEGLKIKHMCLPAELSPDVKPAILAKFYTNGLFDPVRRDRESLVTTKTELGSYGYAGQMMQRPSPAEGGIIKKHWFGRILRTHLATTQPIYFQLDTAYTNKTNNDPTAIIAYYLENNQVYIVNVQSVYMEFPELIEWLPKFVKANGYDHRSVIRIEPKASGKSIVQQLRRSTLLNIVEDVAPKDDKLTRLHAVSPAIEAGRVVLHEAGWNQDFLDEVAAFPNAEHDDKVDCLTAILRRELPRQYGVSAQQVAGAFR